MNPKQKPPTDKTKQLGNDLRPWLLRLGLQGAALLGTCLLAIVLVGIAQRIGWIQAGGGGDPSQTASAAKPGRYSCSMMCVPPLSEPGKCPVCGMEMVDISTLEQKLDNTVEINPAARRILGIQTATATAGPVTRTIRSVGRIGFDEERVATIAAYVDGRLEKLFAQYVGVNVEKGDNLALLYSPKLYSAQVEYLTSRNTPALDALTGDSENLAIVARDNLKELGMSDEQIEQLSATGQPKKRLHITSPIGGTVITKHKVEGDYVTMGEAVYSVVDLSTVWLMLDLYPDDAAMVRFGQQVEAQLNSLPGVTYQGRVAFVDKIVNETTRTVAVRVEMSNLDGKLKPGDYATARIHVPATQRDTTYDPDLAGKWISPRHPQIIRDQPGACPLCGVELVPTSQLGYSPEALYEEDIITVPRDAVLMAGGNSVLYVEKEPGLFELRPVTVGGFADQAAIILAGVEAGETVATAGNFLIDSQMQLSGNASLIDPGRRASDAKPVSPHAAHQH